MIYSLDTEQDLVAGVALANTATGTDMLLTTEDVQLFVATHRFSGGVYGNDTELQAVRNLRPVLRTLFTSDRADAADIVNGILREAKALPQLVRHDDLDWHIHATPHNRPLATRMAVGIAMAMSELIRADDLGRLGICADVHCDRITIDLSRNRSRQFCSTACGNRAAVAAYRARQAFAMREAVTDIDERRQRSS